MTSPIIIVGSGGFGREVHDVVNAINVSAAKMNKAAPWTLLGYVDDAPSDVDKSRVNDLGSEILGPVTDAGRYAGSAYVIGIGSGAVRERLAVSLDQAGLKAAVLVHPSATHGAQVTLQPGVVLCAGVRLTTNIAVGRHVHVNINCSVGHDSTLEEFCTVNPLVAISGSCRIGARAMLGTHSAILQGLSVGPDSTVGASACVVRDVPPGAVVKGIPAK